MNTEPLPASLAFERRPRVPLRLFAPLRDKLYLAGISLVPFRSARPRIDPSILTEPGAVYSITSPALPASSPNVEAELVLVEDAGCTVAALESEVRDERPREPPCARTSAALQKRTLTG